MFCRSLLSFQKQKGRRRDDSERDVSELIALGLPADHKRQRLDTQFDARLFQQGTGTDSVRRARASAESFVPGESGGELATGGALLRRGFFCRASREEKTRRTNSTASLSSPNAKELAFTSSVETALCSPSGEAPPPRQLEASAGDARLFAFAVEKRRFSDSSWR